MTELEVREVFRKIANGERRHGGFLTKFAEALMLADEFNFKILQPSAERLVEKYHIAEYAK